MSIFGTIKRGLNALNPLHAAGRRIVGGLVGGENAGEAASNAGRQFLRSNTDRFVGGAAAGAGYLGAGALGGLGGAAGAAGAGGAGAGGGSLGGAANLAGLGGSTLEIIKKVAPWLLAGYGAYQNAQAGQNAENLQNEGLNIARQRWQEGGPLRAQALGMLQQPLPTGPDLSSTFADSGNPYYKGPLPAMNTNRPPVPGTPPPPSLTPPGGPPGDQGGRMVGGGTGYVPPPNAIPTGRRAQPRF